MIELPTPQRIYAKSLWIRLWHWGNALLIVGLAVSGVSLHFADPKLSLLEFSVAAAVHRFAGVALILFYVGFLVGNLSSGAWRRFLPQRSGLVSRCLAQARYYGWGRFRGEASPAAASAGVPEFNALQAIVYCVILFVVLPVVVISGLVFLNPELAAGRFLGLSGLLPVAVIHYVSAALIVAFMIGHVYLGTMGRSPTSAFKTMITGWHEH